MHWAQALVFCGCLMGASIYDVRHRLVDDRVCVALVLEGLITCETIGFEDYPCEMTMLRWLSQKAQLLLWR